MKQGIVISDHALVRFMERSEGFDFEPFRRKISAACREGGGGPGRRSISSGGLTYFMDGFKVISVVPGSSPSSARAKTQRHKGRSVKFNKGKP